MLFDLQGKRRRMVQVTYVTLAILMGGGLVLFGIGGDVQGGIFDAFTGEGGSSNNGNSVIEKRVDSNEKKLKASPQSERLRKSLTRDYYQLATAQADASGKFSDDGKENLRRSAANWQAYLALEPEKPDTSLARLALQVYDPTALNRKAQAQKAAQLIAQEENDAQAYLNLVQYAALAGDTRTADLAGQKAVDLAPAAQRKQVRAQVKQLKNPQAAQGAQGGQGAAGSGATPQQ
ncbi:MAG TPA: hypothetical protein VFY44_06055 [Thermoleophilaceae bacterium]|nr:hypothetical protein [Thermoleophilaceae bacterium]